MKIATWNVNGIRARQAQLLAWLESEQPDVVCLQELKAAPHQLAPEIAELTGYIARWHCAGPYSGVGLLIRADSSLPPVEFGHPSFDRDNRVVQAPVGPLTVASVYVPNGGKDFDEKLAFIDAMRAWAAPLVAADGGLLVCGDMNVTRTDLDVHPRERNPKAIGQRENERVLFESLLSVGLIDVARFLHPDDGELFTWWAPWRNHRERNIGWRIDYVLASRAVAEKAVSCVSRRDVGTSDHGPVVVELDL
jgi:exodeoxyribonuclease-3